MGIYRDGCCPDAGLRAPLSFDPQRLPFTSSPPPGPSTSSLPQAYELREIVVAPPIDDDLPSSSAYVLPLYTPNGTSNPGPAPVVAAAAPLHLTRRYLQAEDLPPSVVIFTGAEPNTLSSPAQVLTLQSSAPAGAYRRARTLPAGTGQAQGGAASAAAAAATTAPGSYAYTPLPHPLSSQDGAARTPLSPTAWPQDKRSSEPGRAAPFIRSAHLQSA
jgi:hypothetical protein